jgi:hypothetical protein
MKESELIHYFDKKAKYYYVYESLFNNDMCEELQIKYKYKCLTYLFEFEKYNKFYNRKIYFGSWNDDNNKSFFHINTNIADPYFMRLNIGSH